MAKPSPTRASIRRIALIAALVGALLVAYFFFGDEAAPISSPPLAAQTTTVASASLANLDTPAAPTVIPKEPSLAEQIKALEASGTLPILDRSTDIKGPDQNLNGVRDDIEAWIAALPITEVQKKAAVQDATAMQKTLLVDLNDKVAQQTVGDESMAATACMSDVFMPNYQESFKLSAKIEALTANTKERAYRYIQYNQARSGSSTTYPTSNSCK